jgi:hypothetical protein
VALHGKRAPDGPPALNLDRFGMPGDYATYVWLLYGKHVEDQSPARRAFLTRGAADTGWVHLSLGTTTIRS